MASGLAMILTSLSGGLLILWRKVRDNDMLDVCHLSRKGGW
jgi:hypothetical protein